MQHVLAMYAKCLCFWEHPAIATSSDSVCVDFDGPSGLSCVDSYVLECSTGEPLHHSPPGVRHVPIALLR